jgi:hypothetical protein
VWDQTTDKETQALFAAVQAAATATGISFSVDTSKGGTAQLFRAVFALNGSNLRGISNNTTLLDALNLGGGGFQALARHGTAALLSSVSVAYPYSAQQVLVGVHNAFVDNNSNEVSSVFPEGVLNDLTAANNLDESACPTS